MTSGWTGNPVQPLRCSMQVTITDRKNLHRVASFSRRLISAW